MEFAALKATVHRLATAIPSGAMRPHHAKRAKSGEKRHEYHRRHGPTVKTPTALRTVLVRPLVGATKGHSETTGVAAVYAVGGSLVGGAFADTSAPVRRSHRQVPIVPSAWG